MNGLDDFRSELERELVAAAYRQNEARQPARQTQLPIIRLISAVAAVFVVTFAALGFLVARPEPASAQPFRITITEDEITLDVIDVVEDPDEVSRQLKDEIGVNSELFAVPVHPALVNKIVAVGSTGGPEPLIEFDSDGSMGQIKLTPDYGGELLIEYGRPADNDESYVATVTDPICAELYGQPPAKFIDEFDDRDVDIRYERIDLDGLTQVDVTLESLPPTSGLVDITFLSGDTLIATFADATPTDPQRIACQ